MPASEACWQGWVAGPHRPSPSGGASLCLHTPSWGSPQDTPPLLLVPVNSFDPGFGHWQAVLRPHPLHTPAPGPPSCGRPQWGLLTAQRAHSATTQQLGQFGEENKHFLPVLGLAARQPASSGFLGLLGWEGLGGQELQGSQGQTLPHHPGGGGQAGGDRAHLGRPCSEPGAHVNAKGRAHQTRSTLPGLFPGPQPWGPCLGSFSLRVGFPSVDSTHFLGSEQKGQPHAWLYLGRQAMPARPLGS